MANAGWTVPVDAATEAESLRRWRMTPLAAAVRVLEDDATDEQWLAARRAGIGASELASVLAVPGAYSSPFATWWAKAQGWEAEGTREMWIGSQLEPIIAALFAQDRPDLLVARPNGRLWRHRSITWLLATPDFLACNERGEVEPVECKSIEGRKWVSPPEHIRVQLLAQCAVFGARRGHVVRMAGKRLSVHTIEFGGEELALVALWAEVGEAFMASLAAGQAPEPDWHEATTEALQRLYPAVDDAGEGREQVLDDELVDAFEAVHDARARVLREFDLVRNQVRLELGTAKRGVRASDLSVVVERRQYKRSGYTVAAHEVDEIRRHR